MSATNFTPIQLYRTSTAAAVPTSGNLAAGELAINLTDEKLYFKNAAGVVKLLASNSGSAGSVTSVDVSGGTTGLTTSGGPITSSGTITLAGTLITANGGTGFASYAVGDILYASTTTALSKLADVATGNALISGGVGVAPSYGKIGLTTHISGTLAVGNGGTGATTLTANGVLYGSGTSAIAATAVGTTGQVLVGNTGAAPTWSTLSGIGVTSFSAGTTGLTPSTATTGVVTLAGTLGVANGGTGTATAFTAGSVVFAGASGVYSQSNANLFWDNTNARLGIGTSAPGYRLDVASAETTVGLGYAMRIRANATAGAGGLQFTDTGVTTQWGFLAATATSVTLDASGSSVLAFRTNSTERMRIDSSGNIGIGTTSISYKLEVAGDVRIAGGGGDLRIQSATGTTAATGDSQIYNDANNMIFGTGTTTAERMRIDSSGQVGIGTSAPGYRLDVAAGDTTANIGYAMRLRSNATATAAAIQFTNSAVSVENGVISCTDAGALTIVAGGASSSIRFRTNGSERAAISSDGHFGMGTSARLGTNETLSVNAISTFDGMWVKNLAAAAVTAVIWNAATSGDNVFMSFATEAAATGRGSITYNRTGGLVAYNTTSDYRAKDILGPVTDAGATIDALKIYNGKMKGATVSRPMLIAHEAQEVTPYAVTGEKDAVNEDGTDKHQQMDVSSLVPLLIAELQSVRARLALLEGN